MGVYEIIRFSFVSNVILLTNVRKISFVSALLSESVMARLATFIILETSSVLTLYLSACKSFRSSSFCVSFQCI